MAIPVSPEPSSTAEHVPGSATSVSLPSYTPLPPSPPTVHNESVTHEPVPPVESPAPIEAGLEVSPNNEKHEIDDGNLPEVVPYSIPEIPQDKLYQPAHQNQDSGLQYNDGQQYTSSVNVAAFPDTSLKGDQVPYTSQQAPVAAPAAVPDTVTPLHLLGDQSDVVDCPFCRTRIETNVKKHPSAITHVIAGVLFLTTFCGAAAPYLCTWSHHVGHYCGKCGRKVAYKTTTSSTMQVYGTPEHLREASRYPPAAGAV
ncbi:hypothetical protein G7046_g2999 [Stylonectria norvegica]|nr:hypothetical protein G7046_g2999 [Stylonectria norvegica]